MGRLKKFLDSSLLLLLISLFLPYLSCSNPTDPNDNIQPGRRDYTWTVDTLNIPFTTLQRIWGTSPMDVWTIGPGGDADKTIYHFDGEKWETDGISRPLAPTAIFGFAHDNVWIGGRGGEFWHYNGQNWSIHTTLTIENNTWISIENIWGDSPNSVYAVGFAENSETYKAIIVKFNGTQWQNINLPEIRNSFIRIKRGSKTSSNHFVLGIRFEQFFTDTSYIYEFNGMELNEIYKGFTNSSELGEIENINGEMFFLKGYEICKYEDQELKLFFRINVPNFGNGIWGRNEKDIFLRMRNGIAHYNGSNVEYLYNFSTDISITGAMVFSEEIFIVAYDFSNALNLVLRGKLN